MHRKYEKDGVVCLSVSVDEVEGQQKTLKFLADQGATFENYLLNEENEVWQKQWDTAAPPLVLVYDREGKVAGRFENNDPKKPFTYHDVENRVKQLLGSS
jgi:hypothetical protein